MSDEWVINTGFDNGGNGLELVLTHNDGFELVMGQYVGGECPHCKQPMTREDLDGSRWGGTAPVHEDCWEQFIAAVNKQSQEAQE